MAGLRWHCPIGRCLLQVSFLRSFTSLYFAKASQSVLASDNASPVGACIGAGTTPTFASKYPGTEYRFWSARWAAFSNDRTMPPLDRVADPEHDAFSSRRHAAVYPFDLGSRQGWGHDAANRGDSLHRIG